MFIIGQSVFNGVSWDFDIRNDAGGDMNPFATQEAAEQAAQQYGDVVFIIGTTDDPSGDSGIQPTSVVIDGMIFRRHAQGEGE